MPKTIVPELREISGRPLSSMTRAELVAEKNVWEKIMCEQFYSMAVRLMAERHFDRCNLFLST